MSTVSSSEAICIFICHGGDDYECGCNYYIILFSNFTYSINLFKTALEILLGLRAIGP